MATATKHRKQHECRLHHSGRRHCWHGAGGSTDKDPNVSVLVLEAGGDPPIEALLPLTFVAQPLSEQDWNFTSTKNKYSASSQPDDVTKLTSGKMLGGSSCMDHFIHLRASPFDFNTWADLVNDTTWTYENVLPYFIKSEGLADAEVQNSEYGQYHGFNGPMGVTREPRDSAKPYLESFNETGNEIKLDLNGPNTLGYTQSMFTLKGGVRQCSAYSYIHPVKDRKNLFVLRHTYVTRVIFDGKTAVGVEAIRHGKKYIYKSTKEVVVSAGVFKSPQILMQSGIGQKEHLARFNIDALVDLPVGDNWQDQASVAIVHRTDIGPVDPLVPLPTIIPFPVVDGLVSIDKIQNYANYQVFGLIIGKLTPYLPLACAVVFGYRNVICDAFQAGVLLHNSIFSLLGQVDPASRGTVRLKSTDPLDDPEITTNFFTKKTDIDKMVSYIKDYLKVEGTTFFTNSDAAFINPELPECENYTYRSDEYWECYILHMTVSPYHSVGTCAMGSVVDGDLKVKGVERLRVVDASVIPNSPRGSPHALVIMLAEKASDLIKNDNKQSNEV